MRRSPRRPFPCLGTSLLAVVLVGACGPTASPAFTGPLPVPFNVSDYFAPTGYEGDGANIEDVTLVTMVNDACPTRSPTPTGDCYSVTYRVGALDATQGFAGVLWQYPANNFGAYPGHAVSPGAHAVTGWIRGNAGAEKVQLQVGGINDPTQPYQDSISTQTSPITLTTEWQSFSIGLPNTYGQVLSGFGWIVKAPTPGGPPPAPVVFYIDGIQWTP
jgi:hypothetical protein